MRRPGPRSRRAGSAAALVIFLLATRCDLSVNLSGLEGGCPPPKHGSTQVKVNAGSNAYCVDATEATNADYTAFLASGFTIAQANAPDGVCVTLTDTTPSAWPPPPGEDDFPVAEVNWCQAYAFCAWAGKRLCGRIGGGALANQSFADPTQSQWLFACAGTGPVTDYPYGATFDSATCGGQAADSRVEPVDYYPACTGGFPGLHQMSGNVWEWTDCCGGAAANSFCDAMGGGFDSTQTELECTGERNWSRNASAANIGIRCCMDL